MKSAGPLLILFSVVLCAPVPGKAELPRWLSFLKPKVRQTAPVAPPKAEVKRVHVQDFTGGTGASVQTGLLQMLAGSRQIAVTQENPDFVVKGHSVGGRVAARLEGKGGKEIFDRTYAAPGLDENLKTFADDLILAVTGKPGLATSRIVFVSDRSGTKQIYLSDPEGKDIQQITRQPHGAVSPSLSPDGATLAYTSYKNGFPVVQLLDLGLGWERTVTDTPGSSFGASFAPDGQRMALVMSFLGNPEIFVTDLNTNTAACVSDTTGAPGSPAWHPDGKQVIFSDDRGDGPRLYVGEVPEGNEDEAALIRWRAGYSFCVDPEFSPDGKQVAFTTIIGGEMAVVVRGWPEGAGRVIQAGGAQHPSWSPDGRYLCYSQHGSLYIHPLGQGQRRAVISEYGRITEPRWMK